MTNTKKIIILIVILIVGGFAYWTISPIFIDKRVNEGLEDIIMQDLKKDGQVTADEIATGGDQTPTETEAEVELKVIAIGNFVGLENHDASGTVNIIEAGGKYYVRFEEDFTSTNGPDVRVYLGKNNKHAPETAMGLIKGNIGSQNYEIPAGVNVEDYDAVWLWCKAFTVDFGKADLKFL